MRFRWTEKGSSKKRNWGIRQILDALVFFRFHEQMKTISHKIIWYVGVSALVLVSCAPKKPAPTIASSAESRGYAEEFPTALNGQTVTYSENEAAANEKMAAFDGYPEGLTDPDWPVVLHVVEAADEEGRGQAYADRVTEVRHARVFFDRDKEFITKRINGAVTSGMEKAECNCDAETYGKISYSLKDSVDKKLDERLLEEGEAHRIIMDNEKALGKKNVEVLQAQAADIANTAHVVYVLLPQIYQDLERRLGEVKKVKAALQDAIESETAALNEPKLTKKEKKDGQERVQALQGALASVDGFEAEAEKLVKRAETDILPLQQKYDDAFDALRKKLKGKAGK